MMNQSDEKVSNNLEDSIDEVTRELTLGANMALAFRDSFNLEFRDAEMSGATHFTIKRNMWFMFVEVEGLTDYDYTPNKETEKEAYTTFLRQTHRVWANINSASRKGLHGRPHFELSWNKDKTIVTVGLIAYMVNHGTIKDARKIASLGVNKLKHADIIFSEVTDNADSMNPQLLMQVYAMQDKIETTYETIGFLAKQLEESIAPTATMAAAALGHIRQAKAKHNNLKLIGSKDVDEEDE